MGFHDMRLWVDNAVWKNRLSCSPTIVPASARSLLAASKYYRVDMQVGRGGGRGCGWRFQLRSSEEGAFGQCGAVLATHALPHMPKCARWLAGRRAVCV